MQHAGTVLTRERLIDEVWDANWFGSTKTLDVHVCGLRRKLGDDPADAALHAHRARRRLPLRGAWRARAHEPTGARLLAAFAYVLVLVILALALPLALSTSRRIDARSGRRRPTPRSSSPPARRAGSTAAPSSRTSCGRSPATSAPASHRRARTARCSPTRPRAGAADADYAERPEIAAGARRAHRPGQRRSATRSAWSCSTRRCRS